MWSLYEIGSVRTDYDPYVLETSVMHKSDEQSSPKVIDSGTGGTSVYDTRRDIKEEHYYIRRKSI